VAITCRHDADWQGLIAAMGAPAWASDTALASGDARRARAAELDAAVGEWTAELSPAQVAAACQEHGVPSVPLINGQGMTTDPQYVARGFAVGIDQPGIGRIDLEGSAFVGDLFVGPDIRPAPMVGEHTREIAKELLGLDDADVDRLLAAGVLETTPPVAG
jgi:crotonobetainyl-CoA:carnitine CoA-transferase CaiB-like acyl-CoA transferase